MANLVSLSGLEANLMLEVRLVEMCAEIPELRQHHVIILNGLLLSLARRKSLMTQGELRLFKKYLAEQLKMPNVQSGFTQLIWVSKYVMDSLDELDAQSSDIFKEFVRVVVDVLPSSFDPQEEQLDKDMLESIEEVFGLLLQAAHEIPGLLDPARLTKVEFYRDGFEQMRLQNQSPRQ